MTDCVNANPDAGQPVPSHGGSATESRSTDDEAGCVIGGGAGVVLANDSCDEGSVLRWVADGGPGLHALKAKQLTTSDTRRNECGRRRAETEPPPPASRPMPARTLQAGERLAQRLLQLSTRLHRVSVRPRCSGLQRAGLPTRARVGRAVFVDRPGTGECRARWARR